MGPPLAALAVYYLAFATQRAYELILSSRHARALQARGGVEFGREHFIGFVILHSLYPIALAFEIFAAGARPPAAWPLWLALWLLAQGLRAWCIRSLGPFWNTRVWVLPGARPSTAGPYRWLRHPNYVAVALEFVAAPMMFGAWRTTIAFTILNAFAMSVRIPVEERALRWAAADGAAPSAEAKN
jgi:methyltransferase